MRILSSTILFSIGAAIAAPAVMAQHTPETGSEPLELAPPGPAAALDFTVPVADGASTATLGLLKQLETRYTAEETLHVKFKQTRNDRFFREGSVVSDGELWFVKPDRFRCDYANPELIVNLMTGMKFYNYVPELEQAEMWRFHSEAERDQQLDQIMIGFGAETGRILERYEVHSSEDNGELAAELIADGATTAELALMRVEPRPAYADSCPFIDLKVTIDKTSLMPQKIWYEDVSESSVDLVLSEVETSVEPAAELFDPARVFAPGAEIIDKTEE